MGNNLSKYFAGELSAEEKRRFLLEVSNEEELLEDFIECQNLLALTDWVFFKNDEEAAKQKLVEFMRNRKDK